jgi:hypothetical protein
MNDYLRIDWYFLQTKGMYHERMNRQINARLDFIRSTSDGIVVDVDVKMSTEGERATLIVVCIHYTAITEITNWPKDSVDFPEVR